MINIVALAALMQIDSLHEEMPYSLLWDYSYCILKKKARKRDCVIYSLNRFKCQVKDISPLEPRISERDSCAIRAEYE